MGLVIGLRPVYNLGCEKTEVISSNAEKTASPTPGSVMQLSLAMWGGMTGFTVSTGPVRWKPQLVVEA